LKELASHLRRCAQQDVDISAGWTIEDLTRWGGSELLQELKDYEIRKDTEPVLLVCSEVPENITDSLRQARECYRWGLFAACFGLCRIILELTVNFIDENKRAASWPSPIGSEFKAILNSFPPDVLSEQDRKWIGKVWSRSSEFLHGRGQLPAEDDAWDALQGSVTILERLAARNTFGQR
jgi:hypothetical protein